METASSDNLGFAIFSGKSQEIRQTGNPEGGESGLARISGLDDLS